MVIALLNTSYIHTHRYLTNPNQCCATTPSFGFFDRLDCPYRICTVQDGASTVCLKVRSEPYKDGATVRYDSDRNLAVWLQFRPITFIFFMQQLFMKIYWTGFTYCAQL